MRLAKVIKTLLVCGSVLGMVVWFASSRSSQATSPAAPQSKPAVVTRLRMPGTWVTSAATLAKTVTKISSRRTRTPRIPNFPRKAVGRAKLPAANLVMVRVRTTSPKAIRPRSFPSRTNHPKKRLRLVLAVMQARKSGTTSVGANTGATISAAPIVTRRTPTRTEEILPAQTCW